MATYYMRADGTAASKATATSDAAASTSMSAAKHNTQTFSAGDTIYISDKGGIYIPPSQGYPCIVVPSSGTDGNSIVYAAAPGTNPVINMAWLDNKSGWTSLGSGRYSKGGVAFFGRVAWEDGVILQKASSAANVGTDGTWFYDNGTGVFTYKPSSGTPANHDLTALWFDDSHWTPYAFDLRERSNIEVSGLTIHYGNIGHGQDMGGSASTLLKNIKIHHNNIDHSIWAIWGEVLYNNCVEQDVEIYNNTIDYCNGGISSWISSDTNSSHTETHLRHNYHHNTITNHFSVDNTYDWSYALWGLQDDSWGVDHEAISFQEAMDCTVADNLIVLSNNVTRTVDVIQPRAIFFYMDPVNRKTSGNKVLRNRIQGRFTPAIYIAGAPDLTNGGFENNVIACNVLECSVTGGTYLAFWLNDSGIGNPATGMNYWVNNTINYVGGDQGEQDTPFFTGWEDSGNWTVKNNIIVAPLAVSVHWTATTEFVLDHNDYYCTNSTPFWIHTQPDSRAYKTFTTWKQLSANFDNTGSITSNPLLDTNSALTVGSPAISAGDSAILATIGVTTDINGNSFASPPSMGATEYESSPTGYRLIARGGIHCGLSG